jgi:hypothetical protein
VREVEEMVQDLQRTHDLVDDDASLAAEFGHGFSVVLWRMRASGVGGIISFSVQQGSRRWSLWCVA